MTTNHQCISPHPLLLTLPFIPSPPLQSFFPFSFNLTLYVCLSPSSQPHLSLWPTFIFVSLSLPLSLFLKSPYSCICSLPLFLHHILASIFLPSFSSLYISPFSLSLFITLHSLSNLPPSLSVFLLLPTFSLYPSLPLVSLSPSLFSLLHTPIVVPHVSCTCCSLSGHGISLLCSLHSHSLPSLDLERVLRGKTCLPLICCLPFFVLVRLFFARVIVFALSSSSQSR